MMRRPVLPIGISPLRAWPYVQLRSQELLVAIWTRSKRLACSNRVPERPELAGARLPAGARKGVHGISQFDVDEAGTSDHGLPACARQGPSDSTGPEIDVSKGLLWYRSLEADVRDGHTATR